MFSFACVRACVRFRCQSTKVNFKMFYPRDQQSLCCFLLFQDLKILWLLSSSWYAKECYTYTASLMMACYYLLCTKIHIACQVSVPEISGVWSSILYEQRIFKRGRIVVFFFMTDFQRRKISFFQVVNSEHISVSRELGCFSSQLNINLVPRLSFESGFY